MIRISIKYVGSYGVSNIQQVKEMVYRGVPFRLRGKLWQEMLGINDFMMKSPGLFEFLAQKECTEEEQILRDVSSTFRSMTDYE